MSLRKFILLPLLATVIETCIKTIPPEEYYPTSSLPPNPSTGEPGTNAPITDAPVTNGPVTNAPVTDSTNSPPEKCATCKIDDISPENMETGTMFDSTAIQTTGDCISTSARCSRTDGKVCTTVKILSVTSTTSTVLESASNANEVLARLDCENSGSYSSGTASEISQLACEYTGCELPCTTCDMSLLAPTGLSLGEAFEYEDSTAANGCKVTSVTCKKIDGLVCAEIDIKGPGTANLEIGQNSDLISTTVTCQNDGTYAKAITQITELSCAFTDCKLPCESCDINSIAPTMETGTSFSSTELAAPGFCKTTKITCKRDDDQVCTEISVTADTPSGTQPITSASGTVNSISTTLECQETGKYSFGSVTQINKLNCNFVGCTLPACALCDIGNLNVLQSGDPVQISRMDLGLDGSGCKQAKLTCSVPSATSCSARFMTTETVNGDDILLPDEDTVNSASTTLTCADNGVYTHDNSDPFTYVVCHFIC